MFIKNHFIELFLLVLISTTILYFTIWFIRDIVKTITLLKVKSKYYDIMITKFYDHKKGGEATIIGVTDNDMHLFSNKERKALLQYLKELEGLKIIMKGTNTTFNMFGKYD